MLVTSVQSCFDLSLISVFGQFFSSRSILEFEPRFMFIESSFVFVSVSAYDGIQRAFQMYTNIMRPLGGPHMANELGIATC